MTFVAILFLFTIGSFIAGMHYERAAHAEVAKVETALKNAAVKAAEKS